MTDALDAISARAEAATLGPWLVDPEGWDDEGLFIHGGGVPGSLEEYGVTSVVDYGQGCDQSEADATFIAAARSDVPLLVRALRDVLALHPMVKGIDGMGRPYE